MSEADRPPQLSRHNAAAFQLEDVVEQYHLRTPYPSSLAPFLRDLAVPPKDSVLELGCGTGEIARALAPLVERIDAVDISALMIDRARTMPGGSDTAIRWITAEAERAPLQGPYTLAVAGDALHWMDWETTLPRVGDSLAPAAVLAIVHAVIPPVPWSEAMKDLFSRYSVITNSVPHDLIEELESRGLFKRVDKATLGPERFVRTTDEYIDALHATAGLPRQRMGREQASAFDNDARALVSRYSPGNRLELEASAEVVWGTPTRSQRE